MSGTTKEKSKIQLYDKKREKIYLIKNANKVDPKKRYAILEGTPLKYDPEDVSFFKDARFTLGKGSPTGKLLDLEGKPYTLDEQLIAILMKEGKAKAKGVTA